MKSTNSLTKQLVFLVPLAVLGLTAPAANCAEYGGGTGEPNDPYLIYDANQMNAIGANSGDWDKHFQLMADIDLSDYNGLDGNPAFNLIGRYVYPAFTGVFDGNGHAVSNFTLAPTDANDLSGVVALGMFTHVAGDFPEIRDLTLRNVFVDGRALDMPSAALVGRLRGSPFINACRIEGGQIFGGCSAAGLVAIAFAGVIYDCHVSCHVEADSPLNCGPAAGLLVGENDADIYYCTSSGTVTGDRVGGLVGWSGFATIMSCRSDVQVTGIGYASSGGLVGLSNADIEDCAATGNVVAARISAGGLVGDNAGTVSRSWASGNVVCQDCSSTGGLVGSNHFWDHNELKSEVLYSFATGDVVGFFDVGGLVGDNSGAISDSYASGNANGSTRVGGLVGGNWNPSMDGVQYDNGNIYRSYSVGRPSADSRVGGLVGATGENTTVSNCFWDIEASGLTWSDGGTGKTTAEMQTEATFTAAGWDFSTPIWRICDGLQYPILAWQHQPLNLLVSPLELSFEALEGYPGPAAQILNIANCGAGTVGWQLDEDCAWLDVDSNAGTLLDFDSTDVNVTVNTAGLPKGSYYCELTVFDSCDPNNPQPVPVNLEILGPVLYVSPSLLEFAAAVNEPNTLEQVLEIHNAGGGTLNWEIAVPNDCNWLSAYPLAGQSRGEVNAVTVSVDTNGLGIGFYDCQFTVSDPNATASPESITVAVHICIPGELHVPEEYPTIQSAINAAGEGQVIIVEPGTYDENVNLLGKSITVTSIGPEEPAVAAATIIDGGRRGPAVTFSGGEGSGCVLAGFTITDGNEGIYCTGASPTITNCRIVDNNGAGIESWYEQGWRKSPTVINCTIAHNQGPGVLARGRITPALINCLIAHNQKAGVDGDDNQIVTNCTVANNGLGGISCYNGTVTNCIVWGNSPPQIEDYGSPISVTYTNVQGGYPGLGNLNADPCFADANDDDYHLQSAAGRWDAAAQSWVTDAVSSRCIDAGNPGCALPAEPSHVDNVRLNMGAYGCTSQASRTPANWSLLADLTNDGRVDFVDLAHWLDYWLSSDSRFPADLDRNAIIDMLDYALLAQDWLLQTTWHR